MTTGSHTAAGLRVAGLAILLTGAIALHKPVNAQTVCANGFADVYPCSNVDLSAYMGPLALGGASEGTRINDLWGWTDPTTLKEYALVGRDDGTAFVDVTDPTAPIYLGNLPTNTVTTVWRDIKVYNDFAYVVADGASAHGMQVFDLSELRGLSAPATFSPVAVYDSIGSAHNIVINETSGFAYAVGVNSAGQTCGQGLHMIDLSTPGDPAFAGCFAHTSTGRAGGGYTHDAQCVNYQGPDSDYTGREICIGSNETHISIADVSDKSNPSAITKASYPTARYIHQGWLSDDHRYFYQNDELDERQGSVATTQTVIWDVSDLDDPVVVTSHDHGTINVDHNLYVKGDRLLQAHYLNGLRISSIQNPESIVEVGYFDTMPDHDGQGGGVVSPYGGAWSVYPFFASGTLIVSSSNGLFILKTTGAANVSVDEPGEIPQVDAMVSVSPNPIPTTGGTITVRSDRDAVVHIGIFDLLGREVRAVSDAQVSANSTHEFFVDATDLATGTYFIVARGEGVDASAKFVVMK